MKAAVACCLMVFGIHAQVATAKPKASCFGDRKSGAGVIYLHGIDTIVPSEQELGNRRLLIKIAATLKFDLAIVRSTEFCKEKSRAGQLCWHRGDEQLNQTLLSEITTAGAECFSLDARVGILGFSNAGYLLNAITTQCLPSKTKWFLSIGAAGDVLKDAPQTNANCQDHLLHFMIGKKDITNIKVRKTFAQLKSLGRKIALTEFTGGHEIPELPTSEILAKLVTENINSSREIEDHCDLPGNDLSNQAADTPQHCHDICVGNSKCAAFVFVSGWNRCQLKIKAGRRVKLTMHSGIRQTKGPVTLISDTDGSGKDKERVSRTRSAAVCADLCTKDAACLAATYIEGYGDCWLKSTTGRQSKKVFFCGDR